MRVTLPIKTESTSNKREHWTATHKRAQKDKRAATLLVKSKLHELGPIRLVVCLTRFSPGELDDDNLRGALKGVRDGVATALRVDDSTPLVRWDYSQRRGEPHQHAVEVQISWEIP